MTTIPDSAIRLSYLWPCNAAMAAFNLSESFRTKITAAELRRRWEQELQVNEPLRQLSERPEKGFSSSDKIRLCERLVA